MHTSKFHLTEETCPSVSSCVACCCLLWESDQARIASLTQTVAKTKPIFKSMTNSTLTQ